MNDAVAAPISDKSKKRVYILGALSIVGAILLKWSFIFFFIGMLPAMVAYIIDHDKNKYIFSTVAALNLAGVFPDIMELYTEGGTFTAVLAKLMDISVWFTMYSAAAMGWGIVWISPIVAAIILEGVYQGRILHMENVQKRLEEEWGQEVRNRNTD